MAAPWEYCCRLGTHDPRGNNARKHVAGNKKHCHGTNKRKNQRRWSQCKSHVSNNLRYNVTWCEVDRIILPWPGHRPTDQRPTEEA